MAGLASVQSMYVTVGLVSITPEMAQSIEEEKRKIRKLRILVDLTMSVLYQDAHLTLAEARRMIRGTERAILHMFPDKQRTFDLVLLPRFDRVLRERWGAALDSTVH